MKHSIQTAVLALTGLVVLGCSDSQTSPQAPQAPSYSVERVQGRSGFGFTGTVISSSGEAIRLTGGGSFDPAAGDNTVATEKSSGHGNGGFDCVTNITSSSLAGCLQGQGVRWDTVQLLESSGFKCGGVANEKNKTATTSGDVIVLLADFYRAGDGEEASFRAKMFVSKYDLADDIDGVQNIWIQGFGCGTGTINFNN
jgi:hypothetical protein